MSVETVGVPETVRFGIVDRSLPIPKLAFVDTEQMSIEEMKEAEALFSRTTSVSWKGFSMIYTFRRVAALGLPAATEQVFKESINFAHELFHDPQHDKLFLDKKGALEAIGGIETMGKLMTEQNISQFQDAIDAASLIFAHSILDGVALEYCRTIALASPSSWEAFVDQKRIKLQDFRGSTYDNILKTKIEEFLQALDRESLLTKVDRLFAVCQPPEGFAPRLTVIV